MENKVRIIYEDVLLLVIDKPSGIVVNRSKTIKEETIQDWVSQYFNLGTDLGVGGRAGIVHRLDRETSGVLIVAKSQEAFENLQGQFKEREISKNYLALVHGLVKENSGLIDKPIGRIGDFGKFGVVKGGRESRTEYELKGTYKLKEELFESFTKDANKNRMRYLNNNAKDYSLLSIFPKTGRTHQIRVHLKELHHPIVSDVIYLPKKIVKFDFCWCPRLFLHARSLEFVHPRTNEPIFFESSLPKELNEALGFLTINN